MMDELLLAFVRDNFVTLGLLLAILKTIARATPWAIDDEILQILTGFLGRKK
jgi:hypothetical protein